VDPEEEAMLEAAAEPTGVFAGTEGKDFRVLAAGTAQNIVGLACFVIGSFAANILISRSFGGGDVGAIALGIVTVGTQFAFIAAAGTRMGMDMASVRYVSIAIGAKRPGRVRVVVARSVLIAFGLSVLVGAITVALAGLIGRALSPDADHASQTIASIRAAGVAIPFIALTYVWLGGSRGLKVMRHTLYVQWVAQPLLWIVLMLALWQVDKTEPMAVWAYAASWILAAAAAWFFWSGLARPLGKEPAEQGLTKGLINYGAPRAPAALLSQGLFWIDWFVAAYIGLPSVTPDDLGVYAACVRVALAMVLFLTAVSYVFSPFVADLHARGERRKLDALFKSITRWTVAGTVPILLLMLLAPAAILRLFGGENFTAGTTALRILVIGQAINVSVGAAGFVLIMAGRTGWDLTVYGLSALLDLILSFILVPKFGINGAAAAQAITIALSNWLRLALVKRFVGIFPWDRPYARLAIPAIACGAAMLLAQAVLPGKRWLLELIGIGLAGAIVYVPVLLRFGLTEGERVALRNGLAKVRSGRSASA
jgi:O-antigen/teichoic acid export membrane protein